MLAECLTFDHQTPETIEAPPLRPTRRAGKFAIAWLTVADLVRFICGLIHCLRLSQFESGEHPGDIDDAPIGFSARIGLCLILTLKRTDPIAVGSRVAVISTSGSRSDDTEPQVGVTSWSRTTPILSSTALTWGGIGRRCCDGRSPSTTAVWSSPPRVASNSPEAFSVSHRERLTGCKVRYALGVSEKRYCSQPLNVRRRKPPVRRL